MQIDGVFDIGDEVTVEGTFRRRSDNGPINPAAPPVRVVKPDGVTTLAPVVTPEGSGLFRAKFRPDTPGDWSIRMADDDEASSTVTETITITVRRRRVPAPA